MKAFSDFSRESREFWAFVRFISEKLGYTDRRTGLVRCYSPERIAALCDEE